MILSHRHITVPALFLLTILLCMPVYGPGYFAEHFAGGGARAGFACIHEDADADPGHESPESHQHTHCHELDAPFVVSSVPVLDYSPTVSLLISSNRGTALDGYKPPFDIPPEKRV